MYFIMLGKEKNQARAWVSSGCEKIIKTKTSVSILCLHSGLSS